MNDILVIGSVALDSVKTPFGQTQEALGGSATYACYAASFFTPVRMVAVVGEDFPQEHIRLLKDRGVQMEGLQVAKGRTFRWSGSYEYDLHEAHTLATELNVFETFADHFLLRTRKRSSSFSPTLTQSFNSTFWIRWKNRNSSPAIP